MKLTNLKTLILRNNKIKKLPVGISYLKNLTSLYVTLNKLNNIPISLGCLQNCKKIAYFDTIKPTNVAPKNPFYFSDLGNSTDIKFELYLKDVFKKIHSFKLAKIVLVGSNNEYVTKLLSHHYAILMQQKELFLTRTLYTTKEKSVNIPEFLQIWDLSIQVTIYFYFFVILKI